jgi:hypothetical protein
MRHAQPACGIDIQRGKVRRQGRMQQGQFGRARRRSCLSRKAASDWLAVCPCTEAPPPDGGSEAQPARAAMAIVGSSLPPEGRTSFMA